MKRRRRKHEAVTLSIADRLTNWLTHFCKLRRQQREREKERKRYRKKERYVKGRERITVWQKIEVSE